MCDNCIAKARCTLCPWTSIQGTPEECMVIGGIHILIKHPEEYEEVTGQKAVYSDMMIYDHEEWTSK